MIQQALSKVMTHEKAVITDWCSRNAVQMQSALHAVSELQDQAGRMEGQLKESQEKLTVRAAIVNRMRHSITAPCTNELIPWEPDCNFRSCSEAASAAMPHLCGIVPLSALTFQPPLQSCVEQNAHNIYISR